MGDLLDFTRPFDCINMDMLLYKLNMYEIDGNLYFMIKAMYKAIKTKACFILSWDTGKTIVFSPTINSHSTVTKELITLLVLL